MNSTKSREVIWGGRIGAAKINAESARQRAIEALPSLSSVNVRNGVENEESDNAGEVMTPEEALKHIRALVNVALDADDVELIHKLLSEMLSILDKLEKLK